MANLLTYCNLSYTCIGFMINQTNFDEFPTLPYLPLTKVGGFKKQTGKSWMTKILGLRCVWSEFLSEIEICTSMHEVFTWSLWTNIQQRLIFLKAFFPLCSSDDKIIMETYSVWKTRIFSNKWIIQQQKQVSVNHHFIGVNIATNVNWLWPVLSTIWSTLHY